MENKTIERDSKSSRIAKNTIFLYIRMLFTMLVSLYTSRIVLKELGIDGYGIYNVVGGFVAMFTMFSGSLTTAISRFITFELGKGDPELLKRTFSTSVNIQVVLSLIVLILGETIGVWFLNYKMNISPDRMIAANWVLQCSILTFVINLVSVPYNADIIAHEHMSVFAYIFIIEVLLKLAVAYSLVVFLYDKLIIYAILLTIVALIIRVIYGVYCKHKFNEAKYQFIWDKSIFKAMLSFAGWNFFGNGAYMLNTQGVNILINIFFGVVLNAARGISVQVEQALMGFVNNFMIAINPQITKSYANNELCYMNMLIMRGTKFACYIMFIILIPFIFETDTILHLWLTNVPAETVVFVQLTLVASFCGVFGNCMYYGILATGEIKHYQIYVSLSTVLVFPLTWCAYKLGLNAWSTCIIYSVIYLFINLLRIKILQKKVGFKANEFIDIVMKPILLVLCLALIYPFIIYYCMNADILRLIILSIGSAVCTISIIYTLGLNFQEKEFVRQRIKSLLKYKSK